MEVKQECDSCHGTGLYQGFMEQAGTAVICVTCKGKGWYMHQYKEFTGRKRKEGVKKISGDMTYEEFNRKIKE